MTLLVGWQEGHLVCKKKLGVGLLAMIWLELCTSYSSKVTTTSTILCFNKHRLTQVYLEKWPLKRRERERERELCYYSCLMASFHGNLGKPVPECKTITGFAAARDDEDSSKDKENLKHMQIICTFIQSDRHYQHINTHDFYRSDALSATQPTASKHWSLWTD